MTGDAGGDAPNGTRIVKRSLMIAGHRTSISLEDAFWLRLRGEAAARGLSLAALVAEIDAARNGANLSSAIRVHLLERALDQPPRGATSEKPGRLGQ